MTLKEISSPALAADLDEIGRLSLRLHGSLEKAEAFSLNSLAEHVDEVRELLDKGDGHWKAETVDIVIHGLTLLRRRGVGEEELAALVHKRAGRFKEKITAAIQQRH